jgi:hypothetical protein
MDILLFTILILLIIILGLMLLQFIMNMLNNRYFKINFGNTCGCGVSNCHHQQQKSSCGCPKRECHHKKSKCG